MDQVSSVSVKRLVRFDGDGSIKAYCDLTIGDKFLIKGLRVVEGKKGVFVSMPRQQGKNGGWFDSVSPLTREARMEVEEVVLEAFNASLPTVSF